MELNHLRYFFEVARAGSFTRASRRLRVSQPSISKLVKTLEERHDVRLFDRGRRGVALTEAGRRFLESCEVIFGEVDSLAHAIREGREGCVGNLRIGASGNLCHYVLPSILAPFLRAYPKVALNLFSGPSGEIKDKVLAGQCDLGIFYTPVHEAGLEAEKLGFAEFLLVTGRESAVPRQFDRAALRKLPYLGSRIEDYARPYPALRMLRELGVRPEVIVETNSQETQKRLVAQGYGYTILPRHMAREDLKTGVLRLIPAPRKIGTPLLLCRRKSQKDRHGTALSKPAAVFTERLREAVGKLLK